MRELTIEEIGRLDEVFGGTEITDYDGFVGSGNVALYPLFAASGYNVYGINSSDFNTAAQTIIWGAGGSTGGVPGAVLGSVAGYLGSFSWSAAT